MYLAGLLTRSGLIAFPFFFSEASVAKNDQTFQEHTAAGTVNDSHVIPYYSFSKEPITGQIYVIFGR
jgi:hypothetical protein